MREVIQGEKEVFRINLTVKDKNTNITSPYSLVGQTEISVCFKVGTTILQKNRVAVPIGVVVIGPEVDGVIEATMDVAESDGFAAGDGDIEIVETKGAGVVKKFQIPNAFQVLEKICP